MDSIIERNGITTEDEQLSLLRDISSRLEKMEKRERRRRIRNVIVAILLLAAITVLAIFMFPKVQEFMAQYEAVTLKVQEVSAVLESLEVEKIQGAADFIGSIDYDKMMELSNVLESLDAEKLQKQLEDVTSMIDKLGELDLENLVSSINTIVEKLQPFMNLFKK